MKSILTFIFSIVFASAFSQGQNKIFTSDIDNFWIAYDSIQHTNDFSKKIKFINQLYIEKGTKGLKALMKSKDYSDTLYVKVIGEFPNFWKSIRPNTLSVKNRTKELNNAIQNLKKLYPDLKEAEIYFEIGCLGAAGRTTDNMVLIGTELATGTSATDASDFKNDWYKNIFAHNSLDDIVSLNIHEYVHTQQKVNNSTQLLNQVIKEGAADFIAELALEKPLQRNYISYGNLHLENLKKEFKEQMFLNLGFEDNWLYNGLQKGDSADLGYYMGYEICKSYYNNSNDKTKAIKDIIELNYSDDKTVEEFLTKSKFYKKINKKKLLKLYEKKRPHIIKIEPFQNGAKNVNPELKEIRITFSKEMIPGNYSINYSKRGVGFWPIKGIKGFENNDKTIVLSVDLKPNKEYEFIITNNSFKSKDGYPLKEKEYPVKFKTK
jgi:hypothetical protein